MKFKSWKKVVFVVFIFSLFNFSFFKVTGINIVMNAINYAATLLLSSDTEVKSVEIELSDYSSSAGGSYKVVKSADWTGAKTATIHFELNTVIKTSESYKDVILVLDISESMSGDKLERVKSDTKELTESLLSNSNNRIALITFDSTSKILSEFSNDSVSLVEQIEQLTDTGCTNYYQAFLNVEKVLEDYQKEDNRDLIVLFLTDGYPNEETPNQIAQYQILKEKYPYLNLNAVQYEMGAAVVEDIKVISDAQYVADMTTLNNVLFEASLSPEYYESFEIIDYIEDDYFVLDSIDDVKVSSGIVRLEEENGVQKVVWTFDKDTLRTGSKETMDIVVTLKDEYASTEGYYPTNEKEEIRGKLQDEDVNETISDYTPVLKNGYHVVYDPNLPSGCTLDYSKDELHYVFETVEIKGDELSCSGHLFKGWEIAITVTMINDDYFVMPTETVTIRAKWTSLSIVKSMDGTINEKLTLYKAIKKQAVLDNTSSDYVTSSSGISFSSISSDTNGKGVYTIASTASDTYPIYYYRGAVENNNVIFAGFCWKMVRTTNTGGVKMIYNGIPNDDGSCTATKKDAQIGTSAFNSDWSSPTDVGYMYGTRYTCSSKAMYIIGLGGKSSSSQSSAGDTNYIYSDSVTYDEDTGLYTLVDGENRIWKDTYTSGGNQYKYTCLSETETSCETISYVVRSNSSTIIYYTTFTGGEMAEEIQNKEIMYGNDVTYDESTGMYTLITTTTSKVIDWPTDFKTIVGADGYHYTCFTTSDTCSEVSYIYYHSSSVTAGNYGASYYIKLTGGKNVENALEEMLTGANDEKNKTDSKIKTTIDTWYASNMTDYTDMLEDTVWCNDRTIYTYGGWQKDSSGLGQYLYFSPYGRYKPTLSCSDKNDAFTVDDTVNGNAKLTYPVGLLTSDEVMYAGGKGGTSNNTYYLYTGSYYWTLAPNFFNGNGAIGISVSSTGYLNDFSVPVTGDVRPAISLKPGTLYVEGEGTSSKPYIVEKTETEQ